MNNSEFTRNTIEAAVRLGLLFLLAVWCFNIIKPFVLLVMWGIIIAVAIFPLFCKLKSAVGGSDKLAATIYTLVTLALLITPTVMISNSLIDTSAALAESYKSGSLAVPTPADSVKQWPLVGEKVYALWANASEDLGATLEKYQTQIKETGTAIVSVISAAGGGVVQFILSIIISGIFLANAAGGHDTAVRIFSRLTNDAGGKTYADLTTATIRSVAQGVLGIAIIQTILSGLGMFVMDVPGWGLWTLLVLVMAIAQLPPILILGFASAYVFSVAETIPAVIFLIYCIAVSSSDAFLKPLFLGRGMETPMLVILLGAIGGMIMSGIIGLFVGAVILALGYELFMVWLKSDTSKTEAEAR